VVSTTHFTLSILRPCCTNLLFRHELCTLLYFLRFDKFFLFNDDSCTVVLLKGHVLFTSSDSFVVGCVVYLQWTESQIDM